jgi:hypothetical protein
MKKTSSILFIALFLLAGSRASGQHLGDISNNYWGGGAYNNWYVTASGGHLTSAPTNPGFVCSSGLGDLAKKKNPQPQSIPLSVDSCGNAFGAVFLWEQNNENYGLAYDTMQWYIRHCYQNANAAQTWSAYNDSWYIVPTAAAGRDSIFNFVLYALGLRSDNVWFCEGVPDLAVKYVTPNGATDYPSTRAIYKYLMENPRCAWNYQGDSAMYVELTMAQWNIWSDSSRSPEVFDSTIPTLQQLGLDTLLVINGQAGVTFALPTPPIINSASITENPFDNSTSIALSVGREAYITIAVYNVLGVQIAGAGYAGVFEQGSSTIPINMANAPSGAYFVRISTANNETQTLKLTKE